jgi:hypothetical protein
LVSRSRNLPSLPAPWRRPRRDDLGFSQPGELPPGVDEHGGGGDLLENVLIERGPQGCELGVERPQLLLGGLGERRAGAHEVLVIAPQQPLRLRVEPE